jgi:hypothetical protein
MDHPTVFVNYRRRDAPGSAGRLHDDLARRLGSDAVFRDVTMEPGRDFVDEISAAAGSCDVLLAVIGPRWLSIAGKDGKRRLDDPGDYVRFEIETALRRDDVIVIPVLVEDAEMPAPDELPPSLRELARLNACPMRDSSWEHDLGRLTAVLGDAQPTTVVPEDVPGWGLVPRAAAWTLLAAPLAALATVAVTGRPEHVAVAKTSDLSLAQQRVLLYTVDRTLVWAVVGAVVLVAWALVAGSRRGPVSAGLHGALAGAIGGAISGLLYQGAKYVANPNVQTAITPPHGEVMRCAGYAVAGALIGWALAGADRHLRRAEGLAAGALAGVIAAIPAISQVQMPRILGLALQTLILSLALYGAAVSVARAREPEPEPAAAGRVRFAA